MTPPPQSRDSWPRGGGGAAVFPCGRGPVTHVRGAPAEVALEAPGPAGRRVGTGVGRDDRPRAGNRWRALCVRCRIGRGRCSFLVSSFKCKLYVIDITNNTALGMSLVSVLEAEIQKMRDEDWIRKR